MLIDDVTIKIKAGDGGRGAVAFNKNMMSQGPVGGDGGDGGNLYFEGVSDLSALAQFRYRKEISTPNGGHGKPQFNDGPTGTDLILFRRVFTFSKLSQSWMEIASAFLFSFFKIASFFFKSWGLIKSVLVKNKCSVFLAKAAL